MFYPILEPPTAVDSPLACISFRVVANQSNPSYKPSPFVEQVPWIGHLLFHSSKIPRDSHTYIGSTTPFYLRPPEMPIKCLMIVEIKV